ncbi:hypothetical protein V3C99_003622 [Haemonchus contortus]
MDSESAIAKTNTNTWSYQHRLVRMGLYLKLVHSEFILISAGWNSFCGSELSLDGTPKVLCEDNDLSLDIVTSKPFQGNIFVKGRAKDKSCRQSYANNGTNSYSLPLGKCGMQRLRSANPRGVNFVVTVLVSFHPAGFITKNDRAFHVKCFYMEPDSIVSQSIDVSSLPTTELQDSMSMPKCEYSVRRDSPNGPTLTYANVGEMVYHVWECNPPDMGMLVKKCFVTDGDGEDHAVIDYDGCSTDSFLLSELIYDQNLMKAHAISQVFKYADSNQLYFTCQIRLCQRQMGMCQDVTPPSCGLDRPNRTRRATSHWDDPEIDVATHEMLVLDAEERHLISSNPVCLPKITLPLIPLVLVTVAAVSVSVTMVIMGRKKEKIPYAP